MPTKTADLCDAHDDVEACTCQFRTWGRRHMFGGHIRTVRCYEDIALRVGMPASTVIAAHVDYFD